MKIGDIKNRRFINAYYDLKGLRGEFRRTIDRIKNAFDLFKNILLVYWIISKREKSHRTFPTILLKRLKGLIL
jgi:hypothetical protein